MPSAQGYSGKSLGAKLGLEPGMALLAVNAPSHYRSLIEDVADIRLRAAALMDLPAPGHQVVHLFCPDAATLGAAAKGALASVAEGGMLWVSWPKKGSPLHADLAEDQVRAAILPLGWVDVKVCAVDSDWSGLKFLRRRSQEPPP